MTQFERQDWWPTAARSKRISKHDPEQLSNSIGKNSPDRALTSQVQSDNFAVDGSRGELQSTHLNADRLGRLACS